MSECPCCSGNDFESCCAPILTGEKQAPTAEALMRARYSAYVKEEIVFLRETMVKKDRESFEEGPTRKWATESNWHGLEIVDTTNGGEEDEEGQVEFVATYDHDGTEEEHHERAWFEKEDGKWCFADGKLVGAQTYVREEPKIGRNDPCTCGSGKKYKKCCGKPS